MGGGASTIYFNGVSVGYVALARALLHVVYKGRSIADHKIFASDIPRAIKRPCLIQPRLFLTCQRQGYPFHLRDWAIEVDWQNKSRFCTHSLAWDYYAGAIM